MKIGFFRYSLLNRGGDRMVVEYANYLADQGINVTFYTNVIDTVFSLHPALNFRKWCWGGRVGFALWGLLSVFDDEVIIIDIMHLAPFLGFRNTILYFSQADDVEYTDNKLIRWTVDRIYRWYFRKKWPVITVSKTLTDTFKFRYAAKNCFTVTNGIDLKTFYPQIEDNLLSILRGRKALFFMVRGDRFRKGIDIGLEVLRVLGERSEIVRNLVVWVSGDYLDPSISNLELTNFGIVSDARLRRILSTADIFFYPSRHEGFGLFPLEAMACGCTVVTTDAIPYARDYPVIRCSSVGDVSAHADAIASLALSSQIEELRRESLRVAINFDLSNSKRAFSLALTNCRNILRGQHNANRD